MKTKLLIGMSLLVLVAGANFIKNTFQKQYADILLSSIEVLTADEVDDDELNIVCLSDENSVCVYESTVVLKAYYSAH